MSTKIIDGGMISITFENCECIRIMDRAIERMYFDTDGERYEYDNETSKLRIRKILKNFYIKLNLREESYFFHTHNRTKPTFKEEGSSCIDRLRYCDDITCIEINGESFYVPFAEEKVIYDKELPIPCYKNKLQKNEEGKNSYGHNILTISINLNYIKKTT